MFIPNPSDIGRILAGTDTNLPAIALLIPVVEFKASCISLPTAFATLFTAFPTALTAPLTALLIEPHIEGAGLGAGGGVGAGTGPDAGAGVENRPPPELI